MNGHDFRFTGAADQRYPIQLNALAAKRPECEVDARFMHLQSLGQGVVKIALHVFHDQEVAVAEADHPFLLGLAVPDGEVPRRSKRNAGDARRVNFRFVIAVPPMDPPRAVEVEEAGIEDGGSITKSLHRIRSSNTSGVSGRSGQRMLDRRTRAPSTPSGEVPMFFAVDGDGVLLPGNVRVPGSTFTANTPRDYKARRSPAEWFP